MGTVLSSGFVCVKKLLNSVFSLPQTFKKTVARLAYVQPGKLFLEVHCPWFLKECTLHFGFWFWVCEIKIMCIGCVRVRVYACVHVCIYMCLYVDTEVLL